MIRNKIKFGALLSVAIVAAALTSAGPLKANTLRWGNSTDFTSMDPHSNYAILSASFLGNVYEGLVRFDRNFKIEPALAESWETVNPTTWRFKLRRNVKFHNGNPFTADDVIASFARVTHDTSPLKGNLPAYKSSKKVDDYTIELEVNGPYPLLLNDLTNIFIFDKEWMEANNSLLPTDSGKGVKGYATDNANGTGPFKIESRRPDAKTVFVKNPDWWDKPQHNIDVIEFTPITSSSTRVAAMLSGEIDYTNVAPLQDLPRLSASPEVKVLQTNELRSVFFAFNLTDKLVESDVKDKNPLKDIKVREALYRAIDIDAVQKRAMRGLSRNTGALVAPAIPGYEPSQDERLPFDLAGAKKLLAEAGYPNGFEVGFDCPIGNYVNSEQLCQAIAVMWSQIGVKAPVTMVPFSNYSSKALSKKSDIFLLGWANSPQLDAIGFIANFMTVKGTWNPGGYNNPEVEALIDKIRVEQNMERRLQLMADAFRIYKEDFGALPLFAEPLVWGVKKNLKIFQAPDNLVRLYWARFE
jgi:peptide/nickel transport system substrate-binding protein